MAPLSENYGVITLSFIAFIYQSNYNTKQKFVKKNPFQIKILKV